MVQTTKNPLCDFRAQNVASPGVAATVTTTAASAASQPPSNNQTPYLVVQDIATCLYAGTANQANVRVNLIDGTTGSTPIIWSGVLSAPANQGMAVSQSYLNIKCNSGFATLEFVAAGGTTSVQSVSMGGYYGGGMGGQ